MQGIELVAIFSLLSSLFSLFSAPSSLLPSALDARNRIPAFLQGVMGPRGFLPCRNEVKIAPPTNPVSQLLLFKMPHVRISGCLSCDLFSLLSSCFSRCCSFLRAHLALFTSKFASGHRLCSQQPFELCFRLSTPLPTASILCGTMLGLNCCLLRPSHLDCDCLSLLVFLCALPFFLLGPDPFLHHPALLGPCKNAVNLAGGHLLSSLFSLFSSIPPEDAERARPWRLHMRDGFLRRNHDPPLKCSDSSPQQTLSVSCCCSKSLI